MIKDVKISYSRAADADRSILDLGFKGKKILFVTDEKIWQKCQKFFDKNFLQKNHKNLFLENPKADEKNLKKISAATKNCDFILCLGSGVINDLCKFTSAQTNIPYAVFASAASMNGYLSKNASITIAGHKKTLLATLPVAVFCDLKILKAAPLALTKAGIGDSLCFYSCWFDWYLSHKILGTKFDKKPFEILRQKMDFFVKNFEKFSIRDEEFLKLLIEILLLSGQGMTMAEGSYPASQSEHLIAHTIEMKYPELAEKNLHGQMIAVTTLTSARLQENLISSEKIKGFSMLRTKDDSGGRGDDLAAFFGKKIAAQCQKEYDQKIAIKPKAEKISASLKQELQKIHLTESRLKSVLSHFKIKTSPKSISLSNQQYYACVAYSKFIRNRFTCLDFPNLFDIIEGGKADQKVTFKSKEEMDRFFKKLGEVRSSK